MAYMNVADVSLDTIDISYSQHFESFTENQQHVNEVLEIHDLLIDLKIQEEKIVLLETLLIESQEKRGLA